VVFTTKPGAKFDPDKLDDWLRLRFPENVVRAKGIINLKKGEGSKYYVFQMVGAGKSLYPFEKTTDFSRMVLIGKDLDKAKIIKDLENCIV
jgi:G3E family GTPase